MSSASDRRPYVVPRYRAAADTAFYHVLHGTVPGHQIDYLYCPEVPQGALRQTHFGHLSRLIKYIEPRAGAEYAFALGNLSRDDTQHEPGSGGVALLFALRVPGVTDHAGRDTPPYAHGLVAVGRALDRAALFDAATAFYRRFLERDGARDRRGDFYREYVRTVEERPDDVEPFLSRSIAAMDDLPRPGPSRLSWDIEADEGAPARRIVIVHDDGAPFERIAYGVAALGAMLYRSNIKWTSLSTGRALDIPGGTTVRFVPTSEAAPEEGALTLHIDELPESEAELAERLFGARLRADRSPAPSASAAASASSPVPEGTQTVIEPAATCPVAEIAQTVIDTATTCPAPEVTQTATEPAATCPAPEVTQTAAEPAATCPAPEITQTALDPAATCPMAPLESALDPPASAVRPRAAPPRAASVEPAHDVAGGTAPATSHEASPASGTLQQTPIQRRPRRGLVLTIATVIMGAAGVLFAVPEQNAPPAPQPPSTAMPTAEPHPPPGACEEPHAPPKVPAPALTARAATAPAPAAAGYNSPAADKERKQGRAAPQAATRPPRPHSPPEGRPKTALSQEGPADGDWGTPGGERTWGREE